MWFIFDTILKYLFPGNTEEDEAIANVFTEIDKKLNDDGTVKRKKNDCTPWTQYHYDYLTNVYIAHTRAKLFNPSYKKTQDQLVTEVNEVMQLDKSRTAIARIWNGHVNRDDLPAGKPYFEYDL